jgi:hypothetical protein
MFLNPTPLSPALTIPQNIKEPNANEIAMLLANLAKSDSIKRLLTMKRDTVSGISQSKLAIDQLMDCFVKGAAGSYNKAADFDFLAYLFADLAKFPAGTTYFTTLAGDGVHPLAKMLPFIAMPATTPRRLGCASALKNVCFTISTHPTLFEPPLSILPFILLPLAAGTDEYTDEETDSLPDELQLLDPGVEREKDSRVLITLLETLLLLTTTREGREFLRKTGTYYVVRECHAGVENEEVRETAERVVQVLMRDEEGEVDKAGIVGEHNVDGVVSEHTLLEAGGGKASEGRMVTQDRMEDVKVLKKIEEKRVVEKVQEDDDDSDDDKVVDIL